MKIFRKVIGVGSMFSFGMITSFCLSNKNFDRLSTLVLPKEEGNFEPFDVVKGGVILPTLLPFFALIDE